MTTENKYHNQILAKASEDDDFRASLLKDPAGTVAAELGIDVPTELTINVHEDSSGVVNLVLPPRSELSEDELGQAAGGTIGVPGIDYW